MNPLGMAIVATAARFGVPAVQLARFAGYERKTTRQIPVVILEKTG